MNMRYLISCPHCQGTIYIEEINCGIFTHAVYKTNFNQVDPHILKSLMDELIRLDMIRGCGYLFKVDKKDNNIVIIA